MDTSTSFRKRKDPKTMSVEELDEYISRNKRSDFNKGETNSCNTSFTSNYSSNMKDKLNFNYANAQKKIFIGEGPKKELTNNYSTSSKTS